MLRIILGLCIIILGVVVSLLIDNWIIAIIIFICCLLGGFKVAIG